MLRRFTPALLLSLLSLFALPTASSAQRTGKFDTVITFRDSARMLSVYVPTSYDPNVKYRLMIGLHGLGDNSSNYRNTLIGPLAWIAYFPQTIFVCPEAQTTTADYYDGVGGEAIVQRSMDFAMQSYHIDTSNVILQGFSLGGRAALRYGLEHYAKFKGLLLNTPAVQGVKNALNGQSTYQYAYENASHIPIFITHGVTDVFYTVPIDSAVKQLILHDGMVRYVDVPKIAHTIPTSKQMGDVSGFFAGNPIRHYDGEIFEIIAPVRSCSTTLPAGTIEALVRNTGTEPFNSIQFTYTMNGVSNTYNWTGAMLAPWQHTIVSFGEIAGGREGQNELKVSIDKIGAVPDTMAANNLKIDTFQIQSHGLKLPFTEDFEGSTSGWVIQPAGDIYTAWAVDNTVARSGQNSIAAFNTIFYFDNAGRQDGILTPTVDLTSLLNPRLYFDLAYNYHRYTPPYITPQVDFADTLDVLISTDCGANWTSLYRKGGADLATFPEPILNPLNVQSDFIVPADTNWRRIELDLANYTTASNAMVKFNYISALGGSINIDNVSFSNVPLGVTLQEPVRYSIYPNPATDRLRIQGLRAQVAHVTLLDVNGRMLLKRDEQPAANGDLTLDIHTLPAGLYILQITSVGETRTEKVVIQR